jgi:hypothetical protein
MVGAHNGMLADLAQARSALRVAAGHASELIRSLPDPREPVPGLEWTVGQGGVQLGRPPQRISRSQALLRVQPVGMKQRQPGQQHRVKSVGFGVLGVVGAQVG